MKEERFEKVVEYEWSSDRQHLLREEYEKSRDGRLSSLRVDFILAEFLRLEKELIDEVILGKIQPEEFLLRRDNLAGNIPQEHSENKSNGGKE